MSRKHASAVSALFVAGVIFAVLFLSGCKKPESKTAEPTGQAATQTAPSGKSEAGPGLEVKSHIQQGLAYVSTAKNARDRAVFEENLENAIKEFSLAIQQDPKYADAYSNRAVAYMQQRKFNKAQEDLKRAKELSPESATIRYNLASLYSLKGDVDLGLDELDAALAKGFDKYDALRNDPDIGNLRNHREFKRILEKHKVFITN